MASPGIDGGEVVKIAQSSAVPFVTAEGDAEATSLFSPSNFFTQTALRAWHLPNLTDQNLGRREETNPTVGAKICFRLVPGNYTDVTAGFY